MSETLWSPFGVSIQACGTRYSGWYKLLAKDKRKSAEPYQNLICWKNGSKLANWGAWKERARKDVQNFFLARNLTRSHLASGSINTWPAWPTSPASLLPNQARYCNTMPASSTVSSTSISFSTTWWCCATRSSILGQILQRINRDADYRCTILPQLLATHSTFSTLPPKFPFPGSVEADFLHSMAFQSFQSCTLLYFRDGKPKYHFSLSICKPISKEECAC